MERQSIKLKARLMCPMGLPWHLKAIQFRPVNPDWLPSDPGHQNVLSAYDGGDREDYTNFQFTPNWFDANYERSTQTHYRMTIILPPGVGDNEVSITPHRAGLEILPDDTGRTEAEERVYYSWFTTNANVHTISLWRRFPQPVGS